HNITSMNANRQLGIVGNNLAKATEKLSSGYRINRAADDAAGLAISEKMRSQVRGLNRASDNAQDGISLIQTAEGALDQKHAILQRTRELVVQASNTAVLDSSTADVDKINDEIKELKKEYDRIDSDTEFNKKKLLDGNYNGYLQIGANKEQGYELTISSTAWTAITLTNDGKANSGQLETVDTMIKTVSSVRSKLGAQQNRLEYTVKVDDNTAENMQAAESRIRDTDMADEMTRFSKE
ncbi:MAG TPA: flagellin, partial [Lachnospiraceae bacterium]|nr:flagellin [Lachnospiraceae bacterium]